MKYHPITDTINLLQSQRALLRTSEFEFAYPSLCVFLKQVSEKGFDAKKDLKEFQQVANPLEFQQVTGRWNSNRL